MREKNFFVSRYMSFSPVYVQETDTLLRAIETMKKFQLDTIPVIKEDFSIVGRLTKKEIKDVFKLNFLKNMNLLRNFKVKDIISEEKLPIVFYPKMDIEEAFSVMKCFNSTCIPIVNAPWEKKMIGVLWMEDVLSIMKELSA